MTAYPYQIDASAKKTLGLVVLQSDETLEQDIRRLLPEGTHLHITRVPSGLEVTRDSLAEMEAHLPQAASLFPRGLRFDAIGYGCTSGTAQIGADKITELVRTGAQTAHVTQPVSALLAACKALGLRRLAILSPYIADVSAQLRQVLAEGGIETPAFGSFEEAREDRVARIDQASVFDAALHLAARSDVDGIFLSCTNLRSLDIIAALEAQLGCPVLSSNQVLCWHMAKLAGMALCVPETGRLLQMPPH